MLESRMKEEEYFDTAKKRFFSRKPVALKRGGKYPTREEIHERNVLR